MWLIFLNVLAYLTSCCSANHLVHYMCRQIHIAHTVGPYILLRNKATILYFAFTLVRTSISTLNRTKKSYNKSEDSRSKVYVYLKVNFRKGITNLNWQSQSMLLRMIQMFNRSLWKRDITTKVVYFTLSTSDFIHTMYNTVLTSRQSTLSLQRVIMNIKIVNAICITISTMLKSSSQIYFKHFYQTVWPCNDFLQDLTLSKYPRLSPMCG